MIDLGEKTRHAVQMACVARALARAATTDHRKRVLGRYVFVHLHDVVKFAPAWRNRLLKDQRTVLTAEAAKPALDRLRADWDKYQNIRHFLGAKRQLRDATDPPADQLATFELWADIGDLSVEALVDDAIEIYAQLAALESLDPVDPEVDLPPEVVELLDDFDAIGDEAFIEANASSFASAKPRTIPLRDGGPLGRLVPLVNDVAESVSMLGALAQLDPLDVPLRRFVTCSLPSEVCELLRLTIGPPLATQRDNPDTTSVLAYFRVPGAAPGPREVLENLDRSLPQQTRDELLDWRNRVGAHTDEDTPWDALEAGIDAASLPQFVKLSRWIELNLEHAAVMPGGPALMLLGSRYLKTLLPVDGYEASLAYDGEGGSQPGELQSALPPDEVDSDHVVWVGGPHGATLAPAIAGMLAGRARDVSARLDEFRAGCQGKS